jgi:hypothetical protein
MAFHTEQGVPTPELGFWKTVSSAPLRVIHIFHPRQVTLLNSNTKEGAILSGTAGIECGKMA